MTRTCPLSFPLVAPNITLTEATRLWRTSDRTAKRWAAEHGIAFKRADYATCGKRGRPADFTRAAIAGLAAKQIKARWRCGTTAMYRWFAEIGVDPRSRKVKAPAPVATGPSIISRPRRTVTAIETVKRELPRSTLPPAPCFRCGARGFCGHDGRVAEAWAA